VPLLQGDTVAFAVHHRPVQGTRGFYRVNMRHGVSRLRSGKRHTMGIIFHDASWDARFSTKTVNRSIWRHGAKCSTLFECRRVVPFGRVPLAKLNPAFVLVWFFDLEDE
jgi:hypothetical protein